MQIDETIFRKYDIRGIVGKSLIIDNAYYIANALANKIKKNKQITVNIGYDGRLTSIELFNKFKEGLLDGGCKVINIGLCPSPMLYYSVNELKSDYGVMITGSHNPANYNGFKILSHNKPFFDKDIISLKEMILDNDFIKVPKGEYKEKNLLNSYIDRLLKNAQINSNLKIAWDPGNGVGGLIVEELIKRIPAQHFPINCKIDGKFPNHHPDPTIEANLQQVKNELDKNKCDVAIAFDGDADRIGVIDDEGVVIWGDQLLILYAKEILSRKPNSKIIADVKASQIFVDEIKKAGGQPIIWKTGHSYIKSKMIETDAELAGEMSGHIFFRDDYYGFDDALYASVRLLNLMTKSKQKLSDLRKTLPQTYSTNEIKIACSEEKKFKIIEEIATKLANSKEDVNFIDGIRLTNDKGWWLLRASNTTPCLVVRCEADSRKNLEIIKQELLDIISKYSLSF
jgi:phosphomannomutase